MQLVLRTLADLIFIFIRYNFSFALSSIRFNEYLVLIELDNDLKGHSFRRKKTNKKPMNSTMW